MREKTKTAKTKRQVTIDINRSFPIILTKSVRILPTEYIYSLLLSFTGSSEPCPLPQSPSYAKGITHAYPTPSSLYIPNSHSLIPSPPPPSLSSLQAAEAIKSRKIELEREKMQGDVGEDLLSLRLSIGSAHHFEPTKKRKRSDDPIDKNLAVLLQARDRMIRLGCNRHGLGDDKGLQLVRLLLIYATSVDRNDVPGSVADLLRQLYRNVSLSGEPIQRVAAYFTDGLTARLLTQRSPFYRSIMADPSPEEEFSSFTSIYRATPYYQFAHFTANQAIIEAFEDDEHWNGGCLHVIDFDVSYGFQWPSLIQSLSDKATNETPISLRITGFGRSIAELRDTEARLSSFAGGCLNLFFEFEGRLRGERDQEIIQVKKNATVAVNLAFYLHTLKNYSDISATLMQIHTLNPSVLTLVEKEGSRGVYSGFLSRFMESLHYFAAMFDSFDDCLPAESKERLRIEKHLGRDIRNAVVANEGEKGLRYERLEKWEAVMAQNRFEGVRMSSRSVSQAKLLLKIKSHCSAMEEHGTGTGFRISERNEGKAISLGWQDRHLVTATAWRCAC